jgi:CheY-like chemotaxis protein
MKSVLLVDDDKTFNFINTRLLELTGMAGDVRTAWNGQQALDLLSEYFQLAKAFPDIILLDLNMPVMDGFEFLAAFRKLSRSARKHVTVVVLSSSSNPKDLEKANQLGAHRYLPKPLAQEALLEIMSA